MMKNQMGRYGGIFSKIVIGAVLIAGTAWADRDESGVLEPFRGDTQDSTLSINYDDLSRILQQTVLDTGHSDRREAAKAKPSAGSRIIRGSKSSSRLEGNRVDFHSLMGDNLKILTALRDDLAKVPSVLPLNELDRDEQLAYWLNLYNVTMMAQIAEIFPETSLKKFYPSLWDEKVLEVAGVPMSANDIHHKVLIPKYKNPLIMYGLFQGVIGGPNIRNEAYTGLNVWSQLKANAREFVNSNRGAIVRERILRTSVFYDVNKELFPNFDGDMRRHLLEFAKPAFADKIMQGSNVVGTGQRNWYIADLYGGSRSKSAANTNTGAWLGAFATGDGAGAAGSYGGGAGGAIEAAYGKMMLEYNMDMTRFPTHVIEYLHKQNLRNQKNRQGEVSVEEVDAAGDSREDDGS